MNDNDTAYPNESERTVVLNTEPSGTVTVTPSSGDNDAATLSAISSLTLQRPFQP